jgi:hypothetical protein
MPDDQATTDPTAVILARMEVKLDNALTEQSRHSLAIDRHEVRIAKLENRTTALETRSATDAAHVTQGISRAQMMWAALAALVAVAMFLLVYYRR